MARTFSLFVQDKKVRCGKMIGMINIVEFSRSRLPAVASAIYLQELPCRPRQELILLGGLYTASPHPALHIVKQSCVTTLSGNLRNHYTPVCPSSYCEGVCICGEPLPRLLATNSNLTTFDFGGAQNASTRRYAPFRIFRNPYIEPVTVLDMCGWVGDSYTTVLLSYHARCALFARCCAALTTIRNGQMTLLLGNSFRRPHSLRQHGIRLR